MVFVAPFDAHIDFAASAVRAKIGFVFNKFLRLSRQPVKALVQCICRNRFGDEVVYAGIAGGENASLV